MASTRVIFGIFVVALVGGLVSSAVAAEPEPSWYRPPTLAIMTGFIKEPLKPYTIRQWDQRLGSQMDADRWVADFKEAGASYLIFYDKWIDGLVFHETKTTAFKTHRDFVRQVSDACHRGGLPLVFYFNAISDGNPEFDAWCVRGRDGVPLVFSPGWPTRVQTLHSPFRQVSVEQVRELATQYGRIDGFWLDIFGERLQTSSPFVAQAYEKMFGEPWERASGARLNEFQCRTLEGYLEEVQAMVRKLQPRCVWTSNGAAPAMLASGLWAKRVGDRLDYGSVEGHQFDSVDRLARDAWINPKPVETGLLLNSSWFTPMEDAPPAAGMSVRRAIATAAIGVCQGATVYMALTPGHSGQFGDDLKAAKAVGTWFKATRPMLQGAEPYADVGIVLGTPAVDGPGLPGANTWWTRFLSTPRGTIDQAIAVSRSLEQAGVFARLLYHRNGQGSWPASLAGLRAVLLPESAPLDDAHLEQLRQYVRQGGRLIAFGHASMLEAAGSRRKDYALADLFGAHYQGEVAFSTEKPAAVRVDSEWSPEFAGRNLIDGQATTAWASAETPMPHWAEIALPKPIEVARVELVSRHADGPYLVSDFDVEAEVDKAWKLLKSIRGAQTAKVSVPLANPVRTDRIRVTIRRESYQGKERQLADVESIRVFDAAGRNWATDLVERIALAPADAAGDLTRALAGQPLDCLPMVARVRPATAEVLARAAGADRPPAILRNRVGRGEAILIAAGEGAFDNNPTFWTALRRLVVGEPTLACDKPDRFRLILTRVADRHALHVIDRVDGKPEPVTISLLPARIGGPETAALLGGPSPLPTTRESGRVTFVVRPDPVATVVLR